jgi:hypothetical protein
MEILCHQIKGVCLEICCVGFEMSFFDNTTHRNLDSLGRKKRGNPCSGGEDFSSHSAVVVGYFLL